MDLYKVGSDEFQLTEFEDLTPGTYVIKDDEGNGCWIGARVFELKELPIDWRDLWKSIEDAAQ